MEEEGERAGDVAASGQPDAPGDAVRSGDAAPPGVTPPLDVVVVGAGQAGLAVGYYLRRTGLSFEILDDRDRPGGAWLSTWGSLRLFSPARWSSLPGWPMTGGEDEYPTREQVLGYLRAYEERYRLPVRRPVRVRGVRRARGSAAGPGPRSIPGRPRPAPLRLETDRGPVAARAVVSATGTASRPHRPRLPGREAFRGVEIHSVDYRGPGPFRGRRVLVVGGGNSGAQIVAELAPVADTTWVTREEPRFLPDDVDGRVLFDQATARWRARRAGEDPPPLRSLGDVVVVPPVRAARERGDLATVRPFVRFSERGVVWPDGREEPVDAVIWATGFGPALGHLEPLGVIGPDGRVAVEGTRSVVEPRLWLVGYGGWTGWASATIIGVGRSARATVDDIQEVLGGVEAGAGERGGAG